MAAAVHAGAASRGMPGEANAAAAPAEDGGAAGSRARRGTEALVSPSVLACDLADLTREVQRLVDGAPHRPGRPQWVHIDVMDGHFVPNLSFGAPVLHCLHRALTKSGARTRFLLDVHLMIDDPLGAVDAYADAGADSFTFHIEAAGPEGAARALAAARARGMRAGVAVKPGTSLDEVLPLCDAGLVDMVLVMTVEPGFGGQKFMPGPLAKVRELRERYNAGAGPGVDIQVDGGVNRATVGACADAGANVIVAGSAVYASEDAVAAVRVLEQETQAAIDARRR